MRLVHGCGAISADASILPPLFRGGYASISGGVITLASTLRSCRPFSEAVIRRRPNVPPPDGRRFDLAAPFQRRLFDNKVRRRLDYLFRASILPPLFRGGYFRSREVSHGGIGYASILPPLFRGGYTDRAGSGKHGPARFDLAAPFQRRLSCSCAASRPRRRSFDLAAPFQRRLSRSAVKQELITNLLRSCRPFSEAVIVGEYHANANSREPLRSCRPFSKAVMLTRRPLPAPLRRASILPPLFRGGYCVPLPVVNHSPHASILPPLFRGGYVEVGGK